MNLKYAKILFLSIALLGTSSYAQEGVEEEESNSIQSYTPSKLLDNGQWDVKFFNNLYTQTKSTGENNSTSSKIARQNFFTSTLEIFTGISKNNRVNVGAIIEYRSNTFGGKSATSVFSFENSDDSRNGFSSIAPSLKIQPFENISNFSFQTALHIPLLEKGDENTNVFLDQTAWSFQNRFFYDYTFPSEDWQIFTELNTEYGFGDDRSFANNTFLLAPGAFLSYFPSDKITLLGFVQHSHRLGDFEQNSTSLGLGAKLQLNENLNLESLYSNIVRGHNFQGLGNSFSIGLRALF